jgi:hypothetical protein
MKRAMASMRSATACVGVAFSFLGAAFIGSPAMAYDDQSTLLSVLSLIGVYADDESEKIDYRARPQLVLPPNRQSLPDPQTRGDARPASWPVDQDGVRHRSAQAVARQPAPQPGLNQNPTISPTELEKGRIGARAVDRAPGDSDCIKGNGRECLLMTAEEATIGATEEKRTLVAGQEPPRNFLTEPPPGYRHPVKGGKASQGASDEKDGWSNPGAYLTQQVGRIFGGGE